MIGPEPPRPSGSSPHALWAQWVTDALRGQLQAGLSRGMKVSRTSSGTFAEPIETDGGGGSRVAQYIVTDSAQNDYLVARSYSVSIKKTDPDDETFVFDPEHPVFISVVGLTDILIARQPELRRSAFDRDVLNADGPENIGTADEVVVDVDVEAWDGATFSLATKKYSYEYKSPTYRIASNVTDPDNPTTEKQTVIPRFIDAVLSEPDEDGKVTVTNNGATIVHAVRCSGMGVETGAGIGISLLMLSDGRAWAKSSS
jgi:hypothetical protein